MSQTCETCLKSRGNPDACEADRLVLALHQQMHELSGGKDYLLSSRAMQECTRGKANRFEVTDACVLLEMHGLIKILDRGTPSKGKGKGAARYRYLGT